MNPRVLPLAACLSTEAAGGKAVNLGSLLRAGLPVPDGFAISTTAHREALAHGGEIPASLADEITAAWRALGSPAVAVRSSATAEDAPGASMAGQYETFLGITDAGALLSAVRSCWHALSTPRALAYLREKNIDPARVSMAVVVQRLVPAGVAGVLFTVNPQSGDSAEMLVEASWGLGESVVSGEVQPDSIVLTVEDGTPRSTRLGTKATRRTSAHPEPEPTPPDLAASLCLDSRQLHALWQLGKRVERALGGPQDLEWAFLGDQLFLLQSRPITTLDNSPVALRRQLDGELSAAAAAGRGPWVRHNLSETLPQPTPLTWSVIRRFMSGAGGYGTLQRMVGYAPSAIADKDGVLDLWGGRIFLDLSRAGQMFHEHFAFRYDEDLLRTSPSAAQAQPTIPCGSRRDRAATAKMLAGVQTRLAALDAAFAENWEKSTLPAWRAWLNAPGDSAPTPANWRERWSATEARVLDQFAPESLLPGFLAARHLENLKALLREHFYDEDAEALAFTLAAGGEPDQTLASTADLRRLGLGELSVEEWINRYGHRGPNEFDLASPRWREIPEKLAEVARAFATAPDPLARHEHEREKSAALFDRLRAELPAVLRESFTDTVWRLREYSRLREDAKFELMRGYENLRRLALDAARWLDLDGDVFFLEADELARAVEIGVAPLERIQQRRARHLAQRGLSLPLFLEANPVPAASTPPGYHSHEAFPISPGVAEGPARIVFDPLADQVEGEGFILVCPSTDPSWTPLFARAAGLVLECGGALSHGAVVARELGLPAVVLPEATRLLQEGESVRVDGTRGVVGPVGGGPSAEPVAKPLPSELPPPPDRIERRGTTINCWGFGFWTVALVLIYALPAGWLLDPVYELFDSVLLPLWRGVGLLAVPAVVAIFFAVTVTLGQRLLTNTARLNLAKQRAEALRARGIPSPPVMGRILTSSLVPLAILIGPMVLSFTWMAARLDPASWPPEPGSRIHLTATVDGEFLDPVVLFHDDALDLAASTPASRRLPPIRLTLMELQNELRATGTLPVEAERTWPEIAAAGQARDAMLADLAAYLSRPMPATNIAWSIQAPDRAGAFHIQIVAEGHEPVPVRVALGAGIPPEKRVPDGASLVQLWDNPNTAHPIHQIRVAFSGPRVRGGDVVWRPFAALGWKADFGWLGAYLVFYLPPFFILRRVLHLP
jgi:pyruvate,water dikinase